MSYRCPVWCGSSTNVMSEAIHLTVTGTPYGTFDRLFLERIGPELARTMPSLAWSVANSTETAVPAGSYWLVLVDSPERALGAWLMSADERPYAEAMAHWCDSAQSLFRRIETRSGPCLVLLAHEVERSPAWALDLLFRWLGFDEPPPMEGGPPVPSVNPHEAVAALLLSDLPEPLRTFALFDSKVVPHASAGASGEGAATGATSATQHAKRLARQLETSSDLFHAANDEVQLLKAQLYDLHDDLLESHTERQRRTGRDVNGEALLVESVQIGEVRDEPPLRKLPITVQGLQCGERRVERVELRLIEEGNSGGLMLLATRTAPPALSAWRPNGRTGKTDYMLLRPQERWTRDWLLSLGSADWEFITALASVIERELQQEPLHAQARWLLHAAQIRNALAAEPPHLRYEGVQVAPAVGADAASDVTLTKVSFGQQRFESLQLRCRGEAGGGPTLEILRSERADDRPPLLSWGLGPSGWASTCVQPLHASAGWLVGMRRWRALHEADRRFWRALLDTVPEALERTARKDSAQAEQVAPACSALRRLRKRLIEVDAVLAFGQGGRALLRRLKSPVGRPPEMSP